MQGIPDSVSDYKLESTPYNQHLAWMCRELKRTGKIHSCWSTKGLVKLQTTMNERQISKREQDQDELIFVMFELCWGQIFNQLGVSV